MRTPDQAAAALRRYAQDTIDNTSPWDNPAAHELATDTLTVLDDRDVALDDRDALAATLQRVRVAVESIPDFARGPDVQRRLRAALDGQEADA